MSQWRGQPLEAARTMLGLSMSSLWLDYVGVGGNLAPGNIHTFLTSDSEINDSEYDCLVQALNEHFVAQGGDHPLPYADEL